MKKLVLITALAALLPIFSFAQETTKETPYIEVTGKTEMKVTPDLVYLNITLQEGEIKKQVSVETQEDRLIKGLKKLGVPQKNLLIEGALSSVSKGKWRRVDQVKSKQYTLKLEDLSKLDKVLSLMDELKVKQVALGEMTHSNITELRKQARIQAIKAAKDKATYLLEAIDSQVGRPVRVLEHSIRFYAPRASNVMMSKYADAGQFQPEIKDMTITAEIMVRFEIK